MILLCASLFVYSSCNNEELYEEPLVEKIINEGQLEDSDENSNSDPTSLCDFNIDNIQPNSTVILNCILDLHGNTVNIPENVTFLYEGGDIINGTLNISDNTVISGELLNPSLSISGSYPQTKDTSFYFDPRRWGIIEGKVSNEIAISNSSIFNKVINLAKEYGITNFIIDEMDAYFGVGNNPSHYALRLPSNINLMMSDNTNIRVQPNSYAWNDLILCWEADNILISGGKLWGDRYTHDYESESGTHEFGYLINFKAVHNSVIDNVELHEATGDGFHILGGSDRNADGSLKPNRRESINVTIKNCLINDNRRDNISVVDGRNIFIENNTFRKAGNDSDSPSANAKSVSPRVAVMIESREKVAPDGNSVYKWEITENVHIKNNVFENNRADIVLLSGEKAYIYQNTFKSLSGVTVGAAVDGKIYNNKFESQEGPISNSYGLLLESRTFANGEDRVKNYEVTNNTFIGYQYGILANGTDHTIKDNIITNCKRGITLGASTNLQLDNNIISSNISDSYGFYTFSFESYLKNCIIKNGEINVLGTPLFLINKNNDEDGDITIDNVNFKGRIRLQAVQNITIKNSIFSSTKFVDSDPILINNNI
ncbi:NosD domain-containing protein [Algibacter lectus]|uniref:NosD domain-containing protein n=1 Tax=Algibacter lectus TaxID=221126 RepID=UPI001AB0507F|nr:NosD domain-containing protein [Algibacter lectus]